MSGWQMDILNMKSPQQMSLLSEFENQYNTEAMVIVSSAKRTF